MKIYVGNVKCRAVIGGKDNLLPFDLSVKLKEYLRVRADGYFHSIAYRKRRWDGYTNFINKVGEFPAGFLPMVVDHCADLGANVEIIDERGPVLRMAKDIDLILRQHEPRGYQEKAARKLRKANVHGLRFPRGVYYCATNSGKNTIATLIIKNLVAPKPYPKTLFIVHTEEIYTQAVEFFRQEGLDTGEIRSKLYDIGRDVTVAMVKTTNILLKKNNATATSDLAAFDAVIVDEGHHAGSETYSRVLQACANASVRIVLSGTALENKSKAKNMTIVGLSGPILVRITNTEMFEAGVSRKPKVHFVLNPTKQGKAMEYIDEQKLIIHTSESRMEAIRTRMMEDLNKRTLVTFTKLEHGEFMYDFLSASFAWLRVAWTHGADLDRLEKVNDFKQGRIDILVISMIVQEGLNIHGIDRLVMGQGEKSPIRVKQLAGRAMRKKEGDSDEFELIDVWDQGVLTEAHSRKRARIYAEEGFDVEYGYPNKKGKPKII